MELLKIYFRKRSSGTQTQRVSDAAATVLQQSAQGLVMQKILIPVDGSRNCEFAVRQVIKDFMNNTAMEIHLLNVQPPFSRDIARHTGRRRLQEYRRSQAEQALGPVRRMLDSFGVPYSAHIEIGKRAEAITETARRLRCDQIVMATARKNSLTRLVENSVTNKVLQLTPVPVKVIAGDSVSKWERYGIPAGVAAALAFLLTVTD